MRDESSSDGNIRDLSENAIRPTPTFFFILTRPLTLFPLLDSNNFPFRKPEAKPTHPEFCMCLGIKERTLTVTTEFYFRFHTNMQAQPEKLAAEQKKTLG